MNKDLYIGVMSGTSADGIDVVLAESGEKHFQLVNHISEPVSESLRQEIKQLCSSGNDEIHLATTLGIKLSKLTAVLIHRLLKETQISHSDVRAIGYHGQTVRHQPTTNHPYSVQIGCPSTLAFLTGITTVTDFRMADIAAGGQGAPLVPAFHQHVFQSAGEHRFILNIGGIANISYLPADIRKDVIGFDTGPGNTLLDEWIMLHLGRSFDDNGAWAATGKVMHRLLDSMMTDEYLLKPLTKSTGKEHFNLDWLAKHLQSVSSFTPEDVQRTLLEFTACSIAKEIKNLTPAKATQTSQIYICGGGIKNTALMNSLKSQLGDIKISSTEELGIPPQQVEGSAFAWLASQTIQGKPGNLPCVTGASQKRILGGIYLS